MRGSESIKIMKERNSSLNRCEMCNTAEIHNFLHAVGCKKCKSGLTACHNILVIAKDVQRMCRKRSCADMENCRQKFARTEIFLKKLVTLPT